jgi:predicted ATPase
MTPVAVREPRELSTRFEVLSKLGEGGMGVVYEVRDRETGALLAAKTLEAISAERLYALKSEFRRLADVSHRNLIQLGELFYDGSRCFFTMELVRGQDLQSYVRTGDSAAQTDDSETSSSLVFDTYAAGGELPPGGIVEAAPPAVSARLPPAFDEARLRRSFGQLAVAVHTLHRYGVLHRDLKPSNVLVDEAGRLVVLDFGIAQQIGHAANDNDLTVSGTPAFMAPEQALANPLGPAADWYAFGVMLFYALTGRLPFSGTGATQLIAKNQLPAPRASELIESCPADLDSLCARLLARQPADRPTGEQVVAAFAGRASMPSRAGGVQAEEAPFVGREAELTRLAEAYAAVADGAPVALLIEGAAGLGKTELVEHFLQQLVASEQNPTVLKGRCYEQEFIAYKGLDAVIDMLSRYLKAWDQVELAQLVPTRFNLVAAMFPVLHRVPAIAAAIPAAEVNEAKPELREEAFAQLALLLRAVTRHRPLIVFIDDLQWAGEDTLIALRYLTAGPVRPCLLLLATSRETPRWTDEPGARASVAELAQLSFERIALLPLSHAESSELTSKIFALARAHPVDSALLDRLLEESGGHPLFLRELARYLQRGEKLPRDLRLEDVLRQRISALEPAARRLLEVVAIAGVPLSTRVVARVAGIGREASANLVRMLRTAQLIRVSKSAQRQQTLEPYHDRVREAVGHGAVQGSYTLAVARDPAAVHLALARQLLRARQDEPLTVPVSTLANQYNLALPALREPEDAREAVAINLEAARLAKLSAGYSNALHYIDAARAHAAVWSDGAEKASASRSIDLRELELTLLMPDLERARTVFARLLREAPGDAALAESYQVKINGETATSRYADALASAREGLRKLAFAFPSRGSKWRLLLDVVRLELALRGHTSESILAMPLSTDERTRAQTVLLMASGPAAFFTDTALMSLLALRVTLLTLKRGVSEFSSYGFASYALVLGGAFRKFVRAHEFGLLAIRLNERLQNRALDCKLQTMYTLFCVPYVGPVDDVWAGIRHAQELGLANGDLAFRAYAVCALPSFAMIAGRPLSEQTTACLEGVRVAEQDGNLDLKLMSELRLRSIRCLDGRNAGTLMDDADSSEQQFLATFAGQPLQATRFTYHLLQAILGVHFDDAALTLRADELAKPYAPGQFNMPTLIELSFYVALAATRQCASVGALAKLALLHTAWHHVTQLGEFARASERNFGSRYLLARGELRRAIGRRQAARVDIEASLALARQHSVHNVAALGYERLAMWHQLYGTPVERQAALEGALAAYQRWGAHACAQRVARLIEPTGLGPSGA